MLRGAELLHPAPKLGDISTVATGPQTDNPGKGAAEIAESRQRRWAICRLRN